MKVPAEVSIRRHDDGFARISIGRLTHAKLKSMAEDEGVTMAFLIRELVNEASKGKQQRMNINAGSYFDRVYDRMTGNNPTPTETRALEAIGAYGDWFERTLFGFFRLVYHLYGLEIPPVLAEGRSGESVFDNIVNIMSLEHCKKLSHALQRKLNQPELTNREADT